MSRAACGAKIAASQRGEREHAYDIGMAYLEGHSGAPQNFTKAKEWFAKAAAMVEKYLTPQDREDVKYLRSLPGR